MLRWVALDEVVSGKAVSIHPVDKVRYPEC